MRTIALALLLATAPPTGCPEPDLRLHDPAKVLAETPPVPPKHTEVSPDRTGTASYLGVGASLGLLVGMMFGWVVANIERR